MVNKQYGLVPPDDGWAYMIGISMTINYIVMNSFAPCIGFIFNDFFVELDMGTMDILVLNGINAMMIAISSFLTGPLLKVMSMRKLAFLSSTLLNVGVFCTVFVNERYQLIICQGIFQNFGFGILYNISCTSGIDYFLKKRFFIMNLSQTIAALMAILAPWLVHWTTEVYGPRGTLVMISAVSLHAFVSSALLQPVKWHLKKVDITPENIELLAVTKDNNVEVEPVLTPEQEPLNNALPCVDIDIIATERKDNVLSSKINDFFDWPFLWSFLKTCACLGIPLNINADMIFTITVPQALYARNWTKVQVALALSLLSFGEVATRFVMTIGSPWLKHVDNHMLYIFGMAVDVLGKCALLLTPNVTVANVSMTLIGCSRSILIVIIPLLFSDVLPPEQYSRGFGFSMLFYGVISLTLGPAIGAVRDATGNYTIMFWILNAIMAIVTITWSIEFFHNRKAKKVVQ